MSSVLVMGGFTESRRLLEPVAEAAVAEGLGHDAEILTLVQAAKMQSEYLRKFMAGTIVVSHSAGVVVTPDARQRVSSSELPLDMLIFAAPEPRHVSDLKKAGREKAAEYIFGLNEHELKDQRRVVAGNAAELLAHPIVNGRLIEDVSPFSTLGSLDNGAILARRRIGNFVMEDDIFFAMQRGWRNEDRVLRLEARGYVFDELAGDHDEMLFDPAGVFRGAKWAFATTPKNRLEHSLT